MEMSFVEQNDIFNVVEPIFYDLFTKFGNGKIVNQIPFPRITIVKPLMNMELTNPI